MNLTDVAVYVEPQIIASPFPMRAIDNYGVVK